MPEQLSSRPEPGGVKRGLPFLACDAIRLASILSLFALPAFAARAQDYTCSLGRIRERVPPRYPIALQGRILEGAVTVLTTFAPDGHVVSSKPLTGPAQLRFEAQAYINGWRAEPSESQRQCSIELDYRFDGSQGGCSRQAEINVQAEHTDGTHVILHLSCDL